MAVLCVCSRRLRKLPGVSSSMWGIERIGWREDGRRTRRAEDMVNYCNVFTPVLSAPSFLPYRIKGRTRPIALVHAHGQPPD
jgi:hypothetical protein